MTLFQQQTVIKAAKAARAAGVEALNAAFDATNNPFCETCKQRAGTTALEAYRAAQAAEDAAFELDPEEALENKTVWNTHCQAMRAADFARRAADSASRRA